MARPTEADLAHAAGLLEELAVRYDRTNNPNGWPDLCRLLDLLVWGDTELAHAKAAAAYGPGGERSPEGGGTIGAHTIGRTGHSRPVESRLDWGTDDEDLSLRPHLRPRPRLRPELTDPLVRDLKGFRTSINTGVGQLVDSLAGQAKDIANHPHRTEQAG